MKDNAQIRRYRTPQKYLQSLPKMMNEELWTQVPPYIGLMTVRDLMAFFSRLHYPDVNIIDDDYQFIFQLLYYISLELNTKQSEQFDEFHSEEDGNDP